MIKADLDFTIPQTNGAKRWSAPFPSNEFCMFEWDHAQLAANWAPAALDGTVFIQIPSGTGTKYYLIKESDHRPEGPLIRWTRTYAKIPTSWNDGATLSYNFIGFWGLWWIGGSSVDQVTGRERFAKIVPCKVVHDYFAVGFPGQPATADAIPINYATTYHVSASANLYIDYLYSNPPFSADSVPSRTTYNGWITADAAGSWSIVAETSEPRRWLGPMYERITKYIKAE